MITNFIFFTDSVFTIDPEYRLQNVVQCDFCKTPGPPLHCDICKVNKCKTCIRRHLLDEYKKQVVVPFRLQRRAKCFTKCPKHTSEYCERFCMKCDIPVCVRCVSAMEHCDHECVDVMEKLEIKKLILQRDLRELKKSIYPKYLEIASSISVQKHDRYINSHELTYAIYKHREDLHRNIDKVLMKLKSDIDNMDSKYLSVLNKQEEEIKRTISEIKQHC